MPVSVKEGKRKGKKVFKVVEPNGNVIAVHATRKKAVKQVQAINLTEQRKKGRKGIPPAPKKKKRKKR